MNSPSFGAILKISNNYEIVWEDNNFNEINFYYFFDLESCFSLIISQNSILNSNIDHFFVQKNSV
jgi:hypothetical protein